MKKPLHLFLGLAIGSLVTFIIMGHGRSGDHDTAVFPQLESCRPGPWGDLFKRPIHLGLLDDENAFWGGPESPAVPSSFSDWKLPGYDESRLRELLAKTDIDQTTVDELVLHARIDASTCSLKPSPDFIFNLSPASRRILYEEKGKFKENGPGFRWEIAQFESVVNDGYLQKPTVDLIRQLSYDLEGYRYFCDLGVLMSRTPDAYERRRVFIKLTSAAGLVVRLRVDSGSDVDALSKYWGRDRDNIKVFLRSRSQDVGGALIDIVHLLPDLPRNLLYRYSIIEGVGHDCTWTSYNFFSPTPNEKLCSESYRKPYFAKNYSYVEVSDLRFGDVILLGTSRDDIWHSCVYIADDIVFTKNGDSKLKPWKLDTLENVRKVYFRAPLMFAARRNVDLDKTAAVSSLN